MGKNMLEKSEKTGTSTWRVSPQGRNARVPQDSNHREVPVDDRRRSSVGVPQQLEQSCGPIILLVGIYPKEQKAGT